MGELGGIRETGAGIEQAGVDFFIFKYQDMKISQIGKHFGNKGYKFYFLFFSQGVNKRR